MKTLKMTNKQEMNIDNMDIDDTFNNLTISNAISNLVISPVQMRRKREFCGCEKIYTISNDKNIKHKYKKLYCKKDEYALLKNSIAYRYKNDTIISQLKKAKRRYIRYLETFMWFEDIKETDDLIDYMKEFISGENSSTDIRYKIMKEIDLLIMDCLDNETIEIIGTENFNF